MRLRKNNIDLQIEEVSLLKEEFQTHDFKLLINDDKKEVKENHLSESRNQEYTLKTEEF